MVAAWLITLPAAAVVGAAMWYIAHLFGNLAGALVVVALLLLAAGAVWLRARRTPIDHHNVNDDWDATMDTPVDADARIPAAAAS
jgi:PiT family inorganic phosphate transporter